MSNENICEKNNPCQNNSTCVYDKLKKTYYCECVDGYTNKNCTDLNGNFTVGGGLNILAVKQFNNLFI
jgi:hypothetical protein